MCDKPCMATTLHCHRGVLTYQGSHRHYLTKRKKVCVVPGPSWSNQKHLVLRTTNCSQNASHTGFKGNFSSVVNRFAVPARSRTASGCPKLTGVEGSEECSAGLKPSTYPPTYLSCPSIQASSDHEAWISHFGNVWPSRIRLCLRVKYVSSSS